MILDEIVEKKIERLAKAKREISKDDMMKRANDCDYEHRSFYQAMKKPGLSLIGEYKKASPSMGVIDGKISMKERIAQYNQYVDAISCLTEEDYFHGSIECFMEVRKQTSLPMIRKDFIIDSYQIYEAKTIGADCILLIAAILSQNQIKEYYTLAKELSLDVLVEVHNEEEMQRANKIHPVMIGVNNRNLMDFSISLETTKRLRSMVEEKDTIFLSESGVRTVEDVLFMKEQKVDGLLVGRAFMEREHPGQLAKEWKDAYGE